MTHYYRLLLRIIAENKILPYDTIDLNFAVYCDKHNKMPVIKHNSSPTITTKGNIAVVIEE